VVAHLSDPDTLTLHAVRLLGFAELRRVANRFAQDVEQTHERLLDVEALGWVDRSAFAGEEGWSLTARGRAEGERRLAAELDVTGARGVVSGVHDRFLPLNARFQDAVTRWQVRRAPGGTFTDNDHTDHRWDDRVLEDLRSVGRRLGPLEAELTEVLARFAGYAHRYDAALEHALAGGGARWVDAIGLDSCHVVWMQLHEDLLATLGLERGSEG